MCKLRHVDISDFSLNDENEYTEHHRRVYRTRYRTPVKYLFQNDRRPTDRYWIGLFIVIVIFCAVSWHYHYNTYVDKNIGSHYSAEEIHNATGDKIVVPYNNSTTISNAPSEFLLPYWVFNTITCNIAFLNAHYETNGSTLIWVNVLFCVCLIVCSVATMRSDYTFCNLLQEFGKLMLLILLACRLLMWWGFTEFFGENFIHCGYKIAIFWIIPEALLLTITTAKSPPERDPNSRGTLSYRRAMKVLCAIAFTVVGIFQILISAIAIYAPDLDLNDPLYIVTVGGSIYISLAIFYFGLMITACATGIALGPVDSDWTPFLRAFHIVSRYHFGTACYHATLIFPRLHAAFVMNEAEFRRKTDFSIIKRFCATHWKLHNVSPFVTAVLGENYSGSIRELLRISADDAPNVKYFQGFTEACTSFFVLLASINSLVLTLLWSQGTNIDARIPIGTWWMIFIMIFMAYTYARAHDAIMDTLWFHVVLIDDVDILDFGYESSTRD